MQFAVVAAPEIEPQSIAALEIRRHIRRWQLSAFEVFASKLLHNLAPVLVREHALSVKLVWDSLDRNLHFRD